MAGKQYKHTDANENWELAGGMTWPHWLTLGKARAKHQNAVKGQEGRVVREVKAPAPGAASEHVTAPVWSCLGPPPPERPTARRRR